MADGRSVPVSGAGAGGFEPAAAPRARGVGADVLAEPEGDFAININTSTGNHTGPTATRANGRRPTRRRQRRGPRRAGVPTQYWNCTAARVSRMGRTVEAMNA